MPVLLLQKIKVILPPISHYGKDELSVTGFGNQGVSDSYLYNRMEVADEEEENEHRKSI